MSRRFLAPAVVALALSPAVVLGAKAPPTPLPWGARAASRHAPYVEGSCTSCHDRKGPDPGPPSNTSDELCTSCHDGITQHAHAFVHCAKCHNAHDSVRPKLLRADLSACVDCHGANF